MFVNVPVMDDPVPLAGIPVRLVVLFLVHEKVVPATPLGLVMSICVIAVPEQTVCVAGVALTVGPGLITIVAVVELEHPAGEVVVMVKSVV